MKQVMELVSLAFDGKKFLDPAECEKYEDDNFSLRFVGLTRPQVLAAFERTDPELADAFEKAGQRIGFKRRNEDGEYRRGPKRQDPTPEPPPDPADEPGPETFGDRFAAARAQISTNPEDRREPFDSETAYEDRVRAGVFPADPSVEAAQ